MFIILKPDAHIKRWLKILSSFKITGIHFRGKGESWVREHYSHIPEEAIKRNIEFFASGECVGFDLDIEKNSFDFVRRYLRSKRVTNKSRIERNNIHVPDSIEVSEKEKELFCEN
jgi:hypothetical protein